MFIRVMIMKYFLRLNSYIKPKPVLSFLVLVIAATTAGQVDPYLAGRAYMIQESYDSARVCLEEALETTPGDAEVLFNLGLTQFALRNFPEAREAFYQTEIRKKGMGSFYLAKTEIKLSHPEQAFKYLRIHLDSRYKKEEAEILLDEDITTLEGMPEWQQLWNDKKWYSAGDETFHEAMFLKNNGQQLEAINLLNQLEKQGYERSRVQYEKAAIYKELGNEKAARSALKDATRSDVRNLDALQELARDQIEQGEYREAISSLDRVIRQDPARFDAYRLRADARSGADDLQGALDDLDLYLTYFPDNDKAIYQKGLIQHAHGKYLDAIQAFNRALELNGGESDYYFARGVTYSSTGTTRYAEKDFSMALDLDPLNGEIWFEKAKVSDRLGKREVACHCYQKAFQYGIFEAGEFVDKLCN
jgi:tetratricopeptide (TPR) repeat protein